jgi:hypothetical protein
MSPIADAANVTIVEANGTMARIDVALGLHAPRCADVSRPLPALDATPVGADSRRRSPGCWLLPVVTHPDPAAAQSYRDIPPWNYVYPRRLA